MKNEDQLERKYASFGKAALLPGMVHMLELMQAFVEELRDELAEDGAPPRRGRPKKVRTVRQVRDEDVEVIEATALPTAEMPPSHPRHPDHPDHAKWKAKLRRNRKKAWVALSPKQQKERLAKMKAGRGLSNGAAEAHA